MSDLQNKLKFIMPSRPISVVSMMVGMAVLGAAGTMTFRSEIPVKSAGKHAVESLNTQSDENISSDQSADSLDGTMDELADRVQESPHAAQIEKNHEAIPDDPFSDESLGVTESTTVATFQPDSEHSSQRNTDSHSPAVSALDEATELFEAEPSGHEETLTQQLMTNISLADGDFGNGNYAQAMQAYQAIRQRSEGAPGVAILIRLALCAEAAGRRAAALEAYRQVASTHDDPAWAGVARYGEARCLAATKRHDGLQTDLLRRVLLDESEFLPTVRYEVLHLIGRDLWQEQFSTTAVDLLDDETLTVPEWTADPAGLLNELPLLIHETPTKIAAVQFQVLHFDDKTPDGISVRLSCGTTRLEPLLLNLMKGCRLELGISTQAAKQLQGRTQQVHVDNSRLAILLDGMTIPYDLCWQQQDERIVIMHHGELSPEEFRQCRLSSAERLLRVAVTDGAISRQTGHSRLALATLLFHQKRAADAAQFLQVQIESEPRSVVETEAAFNLGKCLMALDQSNESREAFLRSIDAAGGTTEVKIAAYIFVSRLLMEADQSKLAISNMIRGVSLSQDTAMEPYAALQLGSAYLISGNPQGANSVLMQRRDELSNGVGREAAAFVSALSRFRAAVLADRKEREGWAVVTALAEFNAEEYCGGHWAILVAEACEELGLEGQADDAYLLALKKLPSSWLRDRTVLRLAARYQRDREFEEARLLLATLSTAEANQMSLQAKLRSAEVSMEQNHPDDAIRTCRMLIDSTATPELERSALRIMGQAYERKQNHDAAISCFAGMLPEETEDEKQDRAAANSIIPSAPHERQDR